MSSNFDLSGRSDETMNPELPAGTVTFLFTDIEDSTRLWESYPAGMTQAVALHDSLLREVTAAHNGIAVKNTGDGALVAFASVADALTATVNIQRRVAGEGWAMITPGRLRIRSGLHTGEAQIRDNDYFGPAVIRAARIMSIGHGGQVLLSSATSVLLADNLPPDVTLAALGEFRLKGLSRPERIFQANIADLPAEFPPLNAQGAVHGNLPQPNTAFIGRSREIQDVRELLHRTRLLTLTGPGGTGKTRLSLEIGRQVQSEYERGVWLIELASLTDESQLLAAVASTWEIMEGPAGPLDQQLANYLHDKKILLILDNCEHLVGACARLATHMLTAAPRLAILASSREGLGVPGETTYHLPVLGIPPREISDPEAIRSFEAVQLFLDRAGSVRSGFQLNAANAVAVNRIVRRLDGIPLAIELAAARLRVLSPDQIAARLEDRFRLLTGGSRTALPRQQTLRALIDWSYDFLDKKEQQLLRRLSVFAGGWTLEAAEWVGCDDPGERRPGPGGVATEGIERHEIIDLLTNLVNKSLVSMEEKDGLPRFGFLETIRQYARDKLFEAGEQGTVRRRHMDYFRKLIDEEKLVDMASFIAELTLDEALDTRAATDWSQRLLADFDNIRTGIEWAIENDPDAAVIMVNNLSPNFFIFGSGQDFLRWLAASRERMESLPAASPDVMKSRDLHLAASYFNEGTVLMSMGLYRQAVERFDPVIDRLRENGNEKTPLIASLLSMRASANQFLNPPQGMADAAESAAILGELGMRNFRAIPLAILAAGYARQGELDRAGQLEQEAMDSLSRDTASFSAMMATFLLAMLERMIGHYDQARKALERASTIARNIGHGPILRALTAETGHVERLQGNEEAAAAIFGNVIREFQEYGHRSAVANLLEVCGFFAIHNGKFSRACILLGAAEAIREQSRSVMAPFEREEYLREMATLRENLPEEPLAAEWSRGRKMTLDQAVDFALAG